VASKKETERPIRPNRIGHLQKRLKMLVERSSIRSLAQKSGVSAATLHNYLKGEGLRTLENLDAIATACDVNVSWLLGEDQAAISPDKGEFDRELLSSILASIEQVVEEEAGFKLKPDKKVTLAFALYDIFKESGKQPNTATILPFLKVGA